MIPTSKEQLSLIIKRGFWDNYPRKLILSPDYIQFEDKDTINTAFTRFNKVEIADYRYGIKWIRGIEFYIGREYRLFIRSHDNRIIKISFRTFYRYKKKAHHNKFEFIIQTIYRLYFKDMTSEFIRQFLSGKEIKISDVHISQEGVTIQIFRIAKKTMEFIPWDKVRTKNYTTYYAIYSIENPEDLNRGYSYLDDWNVTVLYSVMEFILHRHKLFLKQR